jgi:hypothetical protein
MHNISYLAETDPHINHDIIKRKEFQMFKTSVEAAKDIDKMRKHDQSENIIPKFSIKRGRPNSNYLELKSYQLLVKNYLNPNTPFTRLFLKWSTGSGKTIAALSIAMNFIDTYHKLNDIYANPLGSVYVIGFTQNIFKDELLKYPEFGFVNRDELAHLKQLSRNAGSGKDSDTDALRLYKSLLKKRFTSRKGNGFFKFIGYKELANNLFKFEEDTYEEMRISLTTMSSEELIRDINNGKIRVNKTLLNEFSNSLVICDEIHNVYNTQERNNWGIALQTILNYHNTCRALFLSATPLNTSPTELIDLLNLLLPRHSYKRIEKSDFFTKTTGAEVPKLIDAKIPELRTLMMGRISFVRDTNPEFIATKEMVGSHIPGIKHLRFVRTPMSKFHYRTYRSNANQTKMTMGYDGQYLFDLVIPNPDLKDPYARDAIGIFRQKDLESKIGAAPIAWRNKYGVGIKDGIITGKILQMENIGTISNKYYEMLKHITQSIQRGSGKTFVYHNYIHSNGTMLIREILLQNGMINEYDASSDTTICSVCGKERKVHKSNQIVELEGTDILVSDDMEKRDRSKHHHKLRKNPKPDADHIYKPVRFAIIHSNLDRNQISKTLERFNKPQNRDGGDIMILIGSKIIKESHSLSCIRNILVMYKPDNISTLIQILGRGIRLGSHNMLPVNERNVTIKIFVSSLPSLQNLSVEEYKYKEKVDSFLVIQKIEQIMHESAIDKYFNYDIIWRSDSGDKTGLDILHYKPDLFKPRELNLGTFNVYYAKNEVNYCIYIIKRLFIEISSVWKYHDLFAAVHVPPFTVEIDSTLISQDLFNIALNSIIYMPIQGYTDPITKELDNSVNNVNIMDKIRDPTDRIIVVINTIRYVIKQTGALYTLVPIYNDEIFIDTEIIFRNLETNHVQYMDIVNYLKVDLVDNYGDKLDRFIMKWENVPLISMEQALCDFGTAFHIKLLETIIENISNIVTNTNKTISDTKLTNRHGFYIKMLYLYDLHNLIIWADNPDKKLMDVYKKYVNLVKSKPKHQKIAKIEETSDECTWIPATLLKQYETRIKESQELFLKISQRNTKTIHIDADLLPIGHYLGNVPRIYYPKLGWGDFVNIDKNMVENPIVIGYDSRSNTGMSIKFKLRNPVKIGVEMGERKDIRTIEIGGVCATKSKHYLIDIANKLGIKISNTALESICKKIRNRLIYLELMERNKKTNIKYFYSILEEPPRL